MSIENPINQIRQSPRRLIMSPIAALLFTIISLIGFYYVNVPNKNHFIIYYVLYLLTIIILYLSRRKTLPKIIDIPILVIYVLSSITIGFIAFTVFVEQIGQWSGLLHMDAFMTKAVFVIIIVAWFLIAAAVADYKKSRDKNGK